MSWLPADDRQSDSAQGGWVNTEVAKSHPPRAWLGGATAKPADSGRQIPQEMSFLTTRAGFPATTTSPGTSETTTLPVPTTDPSPIVAPMIVTPAPLHTLLPMCTGLVRGRGRPSTMSS